MPDCPKCRAVVGGNALFCSACGSSVAVQKAAPASGSQAEARQDPARLTKICESIDSLWKDVRAQWFDKCIDYLESVPELAPLIVKRRPDGDADAAMRAFQIWYVDGFLDARGYLAPPEDQVLFDLLFMTVQGDDPDLVDHYLRRYTEEAGTARFARFKNDIARHIHPDARAVEIGVSLTHLLLPFLSETGIAVAKAFGDTEAAARFAATIEGAEGRLTEGSEPIFYDSQGRPYTVRGGVSVWLPEPVYQDPSGRHYTVRKGVSVWLTLEDLSRLATALEKPGPRAKEAIVSLPSMTIAPPRAMAAKPQTAGRYPTFGSFLRSNWWILLLAFAKLAVQADRNSRDPNVLPAVLALAAAIFVGMFVYWATRYGPRKS